MKTIEEIKDWRTPRTISHISNNPLHASVLVEMKERSGEAYIVITFTASQAWLNFDQFTRTAMILGNRVTGRTENETVLVPLGEYAPDSVKTKTFESLVSQFQDLQ